MRKYNLLIRPNIIIKLTCNYKIVIAIQVRILIFQDQGRTARHSKWRRFHIGVSTLLFNEDLALKGQQLRICTQ